MLRPLVALIAVSLAACEPGASKGASSPAAPALAEVSSLRGFWLTEGYGSQFEITEGMLLKSQVTSISCIPTTRSTMTGRDGAAVLYRPASAPGTLRVVLDGSTDRIRIHVAGTASDITARRLPGPLAVCDHPTPDTPRTNLDVFAASWAEHYPFFDLTRTDWAKVVLGARARVTDRTTPRELFDVLVGMIQPLQDAHSSIAAPELDGEFSGFSPRPGTVEPAQLPRALGLVSRYLDAPLRKLCEDQLELGMLGGEVAYLRIRSFARYHRDETYESGLAALEAALDTLFADTSRWRGLVIDVRLNGGGHDPLGLAIASRLTSVEYVAYAKQARLDPVDRTRWTAEQPSVVRPSPRPGYRGPVVELIGPESVSAAETFTQALLERTPSVARVGQETQGVFSDVMVRRLPNGWRFGLPNERFVTRGKSYDHAGVPPTVRVPVFAAEDMAAGRDAALEAALRILRGK